MGKSRGRKFQRRLDLKEAQKYTKSKEETEEFPRWIMVATGATFLAKAALQARYLVQVGRSPVPDSQGTHGILPKPFRGPSLVTPNSASPGQSSESSGLGPCSASILRLWVEKSRRFKHDLQQEKNQCHMRGWEEERALLGERVWQMVGELRPPESTTDSHFLTKACLAHSHSPSLFAPHESTIANLKTV